MSKLAHATPGRDTTVNLMLPVSSHLVSLCCGLVALLLSSTTTLAAQELDPRLFPAEHDALFPTEMSRWSTEEEPLVRGLLESEKLRQRLLATSDAGDSVAKRYCQALSEFQAASRTSLENRVPITAFAMTPERLEQQLRGQDKLDAAAFQAFDGRWFGRWGDSEVNHDWRPTRTFAPPRQYPDVPTPLLGLQYAWISNGFGWNYLVKLPVDQTVDQGADARPSTTAPGAVILGMVYYFHPPDFVTIQGEKPHVGFLDSPTRLVWLTDREIFLEEAFPASDPRDSTYVITALYHDLLGTPPSIQPRGTQAIYTRRPNQRPEFFNFEWQSK